MMETIRQQQEELQPAAAPSPATESSVYENSTPFGETPKVSDNLLDDNTKPMESVTTPRANDKSGAAVNVHLAPDVSQRTTAAAFSLADMPLASVKAVYAFWAPVYNYVFGMHVDDGRRRAMSYMSKPGRILEIGVGTGLSLPHYDPTQRVVGIDISKEMLDIARKRYGNYECVEDLLEMDCEDLKFPNESFDSVAAMYVATVVPSPEKMMAEVSRVCKPNGTIVVLNHFAHAYARTEFHAPPGDAAPLKKFFATIAAHVTFAVGTVLNAAERALSPMSSYLGFRPNMTLDQFLALTDRQLVEVIPCNYFGYWKLCIFKNASAPDNNVSFKEPGTPSTVVSPSPSL